MEWCSPSSPRQKISISKVKRRNKMMLVTFFDSQGIIHKESVPPGQAVNKEYYVEVSSCLGRAVVQAVSRWLPTAAAQVCIRAACGVCGGQSSTGAGFL
jgi:hypothetical protein